MDYDEFKAFETALALIDECDNGTTDLSSDCCEESFHDIPLVPFQTTLTCTVKQGCRRSTRAAPLDKAAFIDLQEIARIKAKLALRGRNRSRDLQNLELLELHVEATVLQEQADELHRA